MANTTDIKCPNCGKYFVFQAGPEIAKLMAFTCDGCKTTFKVKDAIVAPDEPVQPIVPPVPLSGGPRMDTPNEPDSLFREGVVLIREEDGYPYLFFNGRTTFGRYDPTMQAEVLCLTDDTSMSRQHVAFNLKRLGSGIEVSMTSLCNAVTKAGTKVLEMGETVILADGQQIRLGKTDFTIRDLSKDDI